MLIVIKATNFEFWLHIHVWTHYKRDNFNLKQLSNLRLIKIDLQQIRNWADNLTTTNKSVDIKSQPLNRLWVRDHAYNKLVSSGCTLIFHAGILIESITLRSSMSYICTQGNFANNGFLQYQTKSINKHIDI